MSFTIIWVLQIRVGLNLKLGLPVCWYAGLSVCNLKSLPCVVPVYMLVIVCLYACLPAWLSTSMHAWFFDDLYMRICVAMCPKKAVSSYFLLLPCHTRNCARQDIVGATLWDVCLAARFLAFLIRSTGPTPTFSSSLSNALMVL